MLHTLLQYTIGSNSSVSNRDKLIDSYGFIEQLTVNEQAFNGILELTSTVCDLSSAFICLIRESNLYFLTLNHEGVQIKDINQSYCKYTLDRKSILIIEDTNNTAYKITRPNKDINFYAGYPLINNENQHIGSFGVMDKLPRQLTEKQIRLIKILSEHLMSILENQRGLISLIKDINTNFKRTAACSDFNCLHGELQHLHNEVLIQSNLTLKQKEKLEKSNERLESFAHVIAHDVKAPLRSINSFTQLIKSKLDNSSLEKTEEYFDYVKSASENLTDLIGGILNYSEISNIDSEKEEVPLKEIFKIALLHLDHVIESNNAKVNLPNTDIKVWGHKHQLVQLFQNLIGNGLKYRSDQRSPQIDISTEKENDQTTFHIKDNGIGIEEAYLNQIFEPFKRLHTNDKYKGSGIGLSTCTKILENHQSRMSVQSTFGAGSTFSFSLQTK